MPTYYSRTTGETWTITDADTYRPEAPIVEGGDPVPSQSLFADIDLEKRLDSPVAVTLQDACWVDPEDPETPSPEEAEDNPDLRGPQFRHLRVVNSSVGLQSSYPDDYNLWLDAVVFPIHSEES
jgi:hypothetical protein